MCQKKGLYCYYGKFLNDKKPEPEKNIHLTEVIVENCGGWSPAGPDKGDGIDIKYGSDIHCVNVEVSYCSQRGFDIRGQKIFLSNIKAIANGSTGVSCRGSSNTGAAKVANPPHFLLSNVYAVSNGDSGIVIFQDNGADEGRVLISSCMSSSNKGYGYQIQGGPVGTLTCLSACLARSNDKSGIFSVIDDVTINSCQMIGNKGWGFDNNGQNFRHIVVGNIARGNGSGQIRRPGRRAKHSHNITG